MLAIFLVLVGSLLFIRPVLAGEAPTLTSPANSSVVSSSTLNWQAPSYTLYSNDSYRVQVDDDPSFPSTTINKNYYTKNAYYSPVLNEGTWYWRVKAKDSSGIWSEWSSVWSFTLQSESSPTPTPTPVPTPTPSSTSILLTSSSFTIFNIPSQINSDQSFSVPVNLLLPNNPNTIFYLKGAFKKADSANYFGLTKVSYSWVKNGSTYSNQYPITTDSSGNWSGNLEVQVDSEDSGFVDSGDYIFKVAKYTSSGSGPTWSNESIVNIVSSENVESSDHGGATLSTGANNPSSTTSPSASPSVKSKVTSSQSKNYDRLVYHSASVAAATTSASPPNTTVKIQQSANFLVWIGAGLILTGIGLLAYIYLRGSNLHETISNLFRKRN